jgi:hypothetical protein
MLSHNELGDDLNNNDLNDNDPDFELWLQKRPDDDDEPRSPNKTLSTPSPRKTISIINHYKDWDNGEPLSLEGCEHILNMRSDYEWAQAMNKRCNERMVRELEAKNGFRDLFKMNKSKAEMKTKVKSKPIDRTAETTLRVTR